MTKQFPNEDDALLAELGFEAKAEKQASKTPLEERIIAGFEDIQRFVSKYGVPPQHGEARDIFERIYAVRLDRLRENAEYRKLLASLDHQGLLGEVPDADSDADMELDDDALLAELGVVPDSTGILDLCHVRSRDEKRSADEIANRRRCHDFDRFKPLFIQVRNDLDIGLRTTRPFEKKAEIAPNRFFIVGGQIAVVVAMGKTFLTAQGVKDARLRVIFDNGTESNMLMRSLQRALHKDRTGRRISEPSAGPLFGNQTSEGDKDSGTIYVLRSKSDLPIVKKNQDVLHKIGVTSGKIERRIANSKTDPTFLLANVEVVATYKLFNVSRSKFEQLIHRIFDEARLNIEIKDRFGNPVAPREWFFVPLFAIQEAVQRIMDGSILDFRYDSSTAKFQRRET